LTKLISPVTGLSPDPGPGPFWIEFATAYSGPTFAMLSLYMTVD